MEQNEDLFEAQIQNNPHLTPLVEQNEVKRWFQGKNEGTKYTYRSTLKASTEFTEHSSNEIIDKQKKTETKASEKERTRIPSQSIL
jgi:hypothetical protein